MFSRVADHTGAAVPTWLVILFGGAKYKNLLIPPHKKLEQNNDGLHD
jgi:hypothetical protein